MGNEKPNFAFIGSEKDNKECAKIVDHILKATADKINLLEEVYKVGIGDTATDEAIAEEFYYVLHSGEINPSLINNEK